MSFLMRRKKVFLFVFLVVLFFGFLDTNKTSAQIPTQADYDRYKANNRDPDSVFFPTGDYIDTTTGDKYYADGTIKRRDGTYIEPNGSYRDANGIYRNRDGTPVFAEQVGGNGEKKGWVSDITTGIISGFINLISPIVAFLAVITAWIAGIFVNIGIELLRISIEIGITNLSLILSNDGVKSLWEIFRNLGNIALVFILLYIAITTVLQISNGPGKLLGKVIVAAVLMNFSFFFGAIVVDVSNVFSLNIYDEIADDKEVQEAGTLGNFINDKAASGIVAQQFGISRGSSPSKPEGGEGREENWFSQQLKKAIGYTMLTVLDIVLAIVLIIAAFSILGRMVAIILLLLVSPIAFIGMILPTTKTWSSDWWKSLIGQSFYLPVFLLFIYVGIKAIEVISTIQPVKAQPVDLTDLTATITLAAPIITQFAIVIGIFIAALIAANKISSQGSAVVNKIAGTVKSKVAGATIGGAALLGRNTVGWGAQRIADTEWAKRIGETRAGSLFLSGARKVGKSSFDLRGSKSFSGVASATGVGEKVFGETHKGGFAEQEKQRIKKREEYAKSLVLDVDRDRVLRDNPNIAQFERQQAERSTQARDTARTARDQARQNLQNAINNGMGPGVIAGYQQTLNTADASLAQAETTLENATRAVSTIIDAERGRINNAGANRYVNRIEGLPTNPNNRNAADAIRWVGSVLTGRNANVEAASRVRRYLNRDQTARDREALARAISSANNNP